MPELPEVEVVRRGLARWVSGRVISAVTVHHPRPIRRHIAGADDFAARLRGARVLDAVRRGKFLWLPLDTGEALLAHLGMSGQLLVEAADAPAERHLRVGVDFDDGGLQLRFVVQRMFGGLAVLPLVPVADGLPAGRGGTDDTPTVAEPLMPEGTVHIARDALDPHLDEKALVARLRTRRTGIKRAILDQTLVSGVGNIYADEALWAARLHYARPTDTMTRPEVLRLLTAAREVMTSALDAGGTSFDSLYVNVNGASGYFDRSLNVYGQQGRPCPRCGTLIRRDTFTNRSSHHCPRCQPAPRNARW